MSSSFRSQMLAWLLSFTGSIALFGSVGVYVKKKFLDPGHNVHAVVHKDNGHSDEKAHHGDEKGHDEHAVAEVSHVKGTHGAPHHGEEKDQHASSDESHGKEHAEEHADKGESHHEELVDHHAAGKSADISMCESGKQQSPVDLTHAVESTKLNPLQFHYPATALELVNNGHTVEGRPNQTAEVVMNGVPYTLAQFHFHTPSEHRIDGIPGAMEVHFVHKSAKGEFLVVGALIDEGKHNAAYGELMQHLPKKAGAKASLKKFDLAAALPRSAHYYTYPGSLTTPPCTEGIKWVVLKDTLMMSSVQIDAFGALYPKSNRPVQPLNEREIAVTIDTQEALAH